METTLGAEGIETPHAEPVPRLRLPRRRRSGLVVVGELRLPLGGPYRPRATLVRWPDGRLLWRVRLWEVDRAVPHVVGTDTLRAFAQRNGLHALRQEIDELVARAGASEGV